MALAHLFGRRFPDVEPDAAVDPDHRGEQAASPLVILPVLVGIPGDPIPLHNSDGTC